MPRILVRLFVRAAGRPHAIGPVQGSRLDRPPGRHTGPLAACHVVQAFDFSRGEIGNRPETAERATYATDRCRIGSHALRMPRGPAPGMQKTEMKKGYRYRDCGSDAGRRPCRCQNAVQWPRGDRDIQPGAFGRYDSRETSRHLDIGNYQGAAACNQTELTRYSGGVMRLTIIGRTTQDRQRAIRQHVLRSIRAIVET